MRKLLPNEISLYAKNVVNGKALLLLYKDARVDMALLDATFGPMGWKRTHKEVNGNLFCTVSVYDKETGQWVEKEDVGVESYVEKQKGEASDAFKRACYNWGIGRELYTAPTIWVPLEKFEFDGKRVRTLFYVSEISYDDNGDISAIVIVDGYGKERYRWGGDDPKGNTEIVKEQEDLTQYRVETEARLMDSDLPADRKQKALAGVMGYDQKTLDSVNAMLDKGAW